MDHISQGTRTVGHRVRSRREDHAVVALQLLRHRAVANAMRIVSFLPAATEMIYLLGLGDDLVGRSHECESDLQSIGNVLPERLRSGFHLRANLARLVLGAMDIHIQIAGLEARVLIIREFRACGDGPHAIGAFAECDDGRPALA